MKNVFKISKGQLITLWIFGVIGWFFTLAPAFDYEEAFAIFLAIFIPFVLIFYTLGWRDNRKKSEPEI